MKTFKIKEKNFYVTLDKEFIEEFNIDSDYTGIVFSYEEVAKYFFNQSEAIGLKEKFEIEEVDSILHETGEVFSL